MTRGFLSESDPFETSIQKIPTPNTTDIWIILGDQTPLKLNNNQGNVPSTGSLQVGFLLAKGKLWYLS